jgi:hypothetical protein
LYPYPYLNTRVPLPSLTFTFTSPLPPCNVDDWAIHGWTPLPKLERRATKMECYTRGPEPCVHDGYTQKQFNDAAKSVEKDGAGEPWPSLI